jgi:hypothetical protein
MRLVLGVVVHSFVALIVDVDKTGSPPQWLLLLTKLL